jgi:hypothetical protein
VGVPEAKTEGKIILVLVAASDCNGAARGPGAGLRFFLFPATRPDRPGTGKGILRMSRTAAPAYVPRIETINGKRCLFDRGSWRPLIYVPGQTSDDDLLNYAAIAELCRVSWPTVDQRQRGGGWLGNDCEPLQEHSTEVDGRVVRKLVRCGDLIRALAGRAEDETPERFQDDGGEWVVTKCGAARIWTGRPNAPIDPLCDEFKIEFTDARSPVTGQPVKVCAESAVIDAKRKMGDRSRPAIAPPLDGRETIWLTTFLEELRRIRPANHPRKAGRPGRSRQMAWIREGSWHLDGEKLAAAQEQTHYKPRWYVDKEQAHRILDGIKQSRDGKVHPSRTRLRAIEVQRTYAIWANTLRLWAHHGLVRRRRIHLGGYYVRSEIEKLVERLNAPSHADATDGSKLRSLSEAAAFFGATVRRLRCGVQKGQLATRGRFTRKNALLAHEHLVSDADVEAFLADPNWNPSPNFVPAFEIAAQMKLRSSIEYAFLHLHLGRGAREGLIRCERSPLNRFPAYYDPAEVEGYLDSLKPRKCGRQVENAERDKELATLYVAKGMISFESPVNCIALYNERRLGSDERLDTDTHSQNAISKAILRFLAKNPGFVS